MTLLEEERKALSELKRKLQFNEKVEMDDLILFSQKYDDLLDLASVSIKIIDNLVLRQRRSSTN